MRFELKAAWRFLMSGKIQTLLILLGITIGVMVQVFLGFLIQGLQQDLINQTVGSSPHLFILAEDSGPRALREGEDYNSRVITFSGEDDGINRWWEVESSLKENEEITAISPVVDGSAFAQRGEKNLSTQIRGVDFTAADKIYNISDNLSSEGVNLGGNNIFIGSGIAEELDLVLGDSLNLRTVDGISDRFSIAGIFELGSSEINNSWVFMDRSRANTLLEKNNQVSAIELQIDDVFLANQISNEIEMNISGIEAESWQDNNQDLLSALESQSSSSLVIQVFVMLAVTLGIASVLAVSVVQKSKQIGILKAMGSNKRRVGLIFLIQGAILGFSGAIVGSLGGIGLSQLFVNLVRDESGNPLFPIEIDWRFILISIIVATIAGMIAALIPARNSAKLNPVEVIRNG